LSFLKKSYFYMMVLAPGWTAQAMIYRMSPKPLRIFDKRSKDSL
jgi:hypothetical protein